MKRTSSRLGCFLLASLFLVLNACKKSDAVSELSADKNAIIYEREGAEQTLNIASNTNWTAEISPNASWLTIDKTSGSSATALKISTSTNTGFNGRSATLTLKSTGVADVVVTITQKGIMAWERSFAVTPSMGSTFNDVIAVADGFVAVGRKDSKFYIAKLSMDGQTVLKENTLEDHIEGWAIVMNPDGSYVVTGTTLAGVFQSGGNIFAAKLDANLQPVAGKFFLHDNHNQDFPTSIIRTSAGGYAIAGYRNGSMYAVNLDENLVQKPGMEFIYNTGTASCVAYGIAETADGGFAIAGTSIESGNQNINILKLDHNFAMVPGAGCIIDESISDEINSFKRTADGGFILAGGTLYNARINMFIQKLNANLQPAAGKKLILDRGVNNSATEIIEKADHGFIVTGHLFNADMSDRDILVKTFDQHLQPVAGMEFTINRKSGDVPLALTAAPDGGFVLAGQLFDNNSAALYIARFNK